MWWLYCQNYSIPKWKHSNQRVEVDTCNPNKLLTVETEALNEEDIKAIVQKAGFQAEKLR